MVNVTHQTHSLDDMLICKDQKDLTLIFEVLINFLQFIWWVRRHFVPRHFVPGHILSRDNMLPGQYVALCPHYFAVQRGDILSQETYCPGSVRRHIVPEDVLSRLATKGKFWQQMVSFGNKWYLLATNGNFWQQMVTFGNKWYRLATNGMVWQQMVTFGNKW